MQENTITREKNEQLKAVSAENIVRNKFEASS